MATTTTETMTTVITRLEFEVDGRLFEEEDGDVGDDVALDGGNNLLGLNKTSMSGSKNTNESK